MIWICQRVGKKKVNELALFAGAGGGILGGKLLGWRTVCAVEWNAYAASILVQRQNDECLDTFPIWDDVQTFDGRPWRGIVDIISGGFPCQDISVAGKGAGIEGDRSSMWKHMARIIGEVEPRYVFVENSPALVVRGFGRVLGDIAELGFNARWGIVGADACGFQHHRARLWVVANSNSNRRVGRHDRHTSGHRQTTDRSVAPLCQNPLRRDLSESGLARRSYGLPDRMDRTYAAGNAQVPAVVRLAWHLLGPINSSLVTSHA